MILFSQACIVSEMKTVLHVILWHIKNNTQGLSVIFKPKDSRNKEIKRKVNCMYDKCTLQSFYNV